MLSSLSLVLGQSTGPSAESIFLYTLIFIFLTAVITTIATKRARDKCLKFFAGYRVTLERARGLTIWGDLKVFSTGVEIVYDHPYIDSRGRKKVSFMIYQAEIDQQLHAVLRFVEELSPRSRKRRVKQIKRTFRPRLLRRMWRGIRNLVNTLRDAFNAAVGAVVMQAQRISPGSALLTSQSGAVTQIGQTLLSRLANAYEPLLEQYIGQPVILDVADPINPNNATVEYVGYLADYTQQFIALFNVEHPCGEIRTVTLPDIERGDPLPPLPPPSPPGMPMPPLPPPLKVEHDIAVRVDGYRYKLQNVSHEPQNVQTLEREGQDPITINMTIPPQGTLDLPARDAHGARLTVRPVRAVDVVVPRRYATVRHAGDFPDTYNLAEDLFLDRLPLLSKLFSEDNQRDEEREADRSDA